MKDKAHACGLAFDEEYMESDLKPEPLASPHPVWWRRPIPLLRRIIASGGTQDVHPTALKRFRSDKVRYEPRNLALYLEQAEPDEETADEQ